MRNLGFLAVLLAAAPAFAGAGQDVDLKAPDGTPLKATYFSAGKPGPGVVLLHMCNSNRKAWAGVAESLAARGIHAITLDYRGYGESGGERFDKMTDEVRAKEREKWAGDIDRAFEHLVAQPGVDRNRIGAGGGSCGVNNSIQLARRHPEVKTLVLLAGGTDREGQAFLERTPWMPLFASAAHDDGDAVGTVGFTIGFSSNPMNTLKEYADGGHGTDMFPKHRDLEPTIVAWFERHLVTQPVKANPAAAPAPGPSGKILAALRAPGGPTRALADFKKGKKDALPREGVVNALGYEALQAGRHKDAIELFKVNVEAHPDSANAYDSLSEAYEAAKDRPRAVEYAKKALEALARDKQAGAELRENIRKASEARIAGK
jgi:dienelactone hydrolase